MLIAPRHSFKLAIRLLKSGDDMDSLLKNYLRHWSETNNHDVHRTFKKVQFWLDNEIVQLDIPAIITRLEKSLSLPVGATLEKMIVDYGDDLGRVKWDEYCEQQRITNTKEYKMRVHGMTSEEVDAYNLSRACTEKLFIERHGLEEGKRRWQEYCDRQRYAGNQLDYFIEKYGVIEGQRRYEHVNLMKSHTIEAYRIRYGEDAEAKLEEYYRNKPFSGQYISSASSAFLDRFESLLTDKERQHGYREYVIYDDSVGGILIYDYVNTALQLCIEYNGVYWHGDPYVYGIDAVLRDTHVQDLWQKDVAKMRALFDNRDIKQYYIVWEYREPTDEALQELLDGLRNNR